MGEREADFFPKRHGDVPHALCISLVVHWPILGFDDPSFLFGRKATLQDFCKKTKRILNL